MKRLFVLVICVLLIANVVCAAPTNVTEYPRLQQTTIKGMKLIVQPTHSAVTEVTLLLKSGSGLEPAGKSGTALIMNTFVNNILWGDDFRNAEVNTYPDYTLINFKTGANDLKAVLLEVRNLLTSPIYSYDLIMDFKGVYSTDLLALPSLNKAYQKAGELFYGPDHPYGREMTPETIKAVDGKDVYQWYHQTYQPGNAILSIAGGVKLSMKEMEKLFAPMQSEAVDYRMLLQPVIPAQDKQVELEDKNGRISTLCLEFGAPRPMDPDYPAFRVLAYYLENFQYIFQQLRVNEGLMYTTLAYYNYMEKPQAPNLALVALTDKDSLAKVETESVNIMRRIALEGIAQSDIDQVVKTIKAETENREKSGEGLAYRNALSEFLQTSAFYEANFFSRLDQVKTEDIKQAASKYFQHYVRVSFIPNRKEKDLFQ